MSKPQQVQAQFWEFEKRINIELNQAEDMVGKLPPQDPSAVRAYVLEDVKKQVEDLWRRVEKVLNTPDEAAKAVAEAEATKSTKGYRSSLTFK
jgi:hypothetical protein